MDNRFNFFVGIDIDEDIEKAAKKSKGDDRYKNMIVYGMASDNTEDRQGETLEPSGYDFSDFLKKGLINLEHYTVRKGSPKYWIGEPIDAHVKGNEFFIKSKLWSEHPEARNLWDTLLAMKESGSTRKAGYSIEGKTLQKDPNNEKKILKASISHCAITFSPVNANSWIDIVKGEQTKDFQQVVSPKDFLYAFESNGNLITVDKSWKVNIQKSFSLESVQPLMRESIKKDKIPLSYLPKIVKAVKEGKLDKNFFDKLLG